MTELNWPKMQLVQWHVVIKSVTEFSVSVNGEEFLDQLNDYEFLKHSAPLSEVIFFLDF
jgi:hypothetical protein